MESLSVADAFKNGMWVMMMASMPVLLTAMVVGLLMGILQTATSINEQTLAFISKIIAVLVVLLLLGSWMAAMVNEMAIHLFESLYRYVN